MNVSRIVFHFVKTILQCLKCPYAVTVENLHKKKNSLINIIKVITRKFSFKCHHTLKPSYRAAVLVRYR